MKSNRLYYVLQVLELHTTKFLDYHKNKHKFYYLGNKNLTNIPYFLTHSAWRIMPWVHLVGWPFRCIVN
jgi:hypothetical protein